MPIRSPHGRGAAYRAIWQWPLRSPARLAVAVVVLGLLAGGVGFGVAVAAGDGATGVRPGATSVRPPARTTTPRASGTGSTPPTALPPVSELAPSTLPAASAPPESLEVAARWAAAWLRPGDGTTAAEWVEGLRANTTEEYLGVLAGVDPENVPATRVTGEPRAVRVSPRSVEVEVPTDAVTLLVLVVDTGTDWRVAGYEPV